MNTANDLLTDQEIEDLTGAKRPGDQKRILSRNKIYFIEKMTGKLAVCWHHVHHPMQAASNDDGFNLGAL